MGQIWTAYLLCTRITLETTVLRVMQEKQVQILYSSMDKLKIHLYCTNLPGWVGFDGIYALHLYYPRGYYSMNHIGKICTLHVQLSYKNQPRPLILWSDLDGISPLHPYYSRDYRATSHNSKIYPKCAKPIDQMGQIWTAYLLCTRITLETTALRVIIQKFIQSELRPPIPWVGFEQYISSAPVLLQRLPRYES